MHNIGVVGSELVLCNKRSQYLCLYEGVKEYQRTLQLLLVVEEFAKVNQSNTAWARGLSFPIRAPLSKNELFEGIYADAEGIRLTSLCVVWDRYVSTGKVACVDLVRVTGAGGEEQGDLAYGSVGAARCHCADVVLGRPDSHDGVGAIFHFGRCGRGSCCIAIFLRLVCIACAIGLVGGGWRIGIC